MDSIELNIGLRTKAGPNEAADIMSRALLAQSLLASNLALGRVFSRVHNVRYTTPDGLDVVEPTLVVRMGVRRAARPGVASALYDLAKRLQQDCIAALHIDVDGLAIEGMLIGPKAGEWGAFNLDYFVRFDAVADATERRAA